MKKILTILLLLIMVGCVENCDGPTNPNLPPTDPPVVDPPDPPPTHNRGVMFSWNTRGILVFAGTQASEIQIRNLDGRLRSLGWPTPTYHVCAETSFWDAQGAPWPAGPDPFDGEENLANLKRFLDTTADLGSQVMLDVYCTARDARESVLPSERFFSWAQTVGKVASQYDHVVIHIANEHWHQGSRLRSLPAMREAKHRLRRHFHGAISSDDNFNPGRIRFDSLGGLLEWPDAHPWRSPDDPNKREIERMVELNGSIVISEPTAYSEEEEFYRQTCCTDDRERITRYMNRCESTSGCVWFYHSTDGLGWPARSPSFDWIPR